MGNKTKSNLFFIIWRIRKPLRYKSSLERWLHFHLRTSDILLCIMQVYIFRFAEQISIKHWLLQDDTLADLFGDLFQSLFLVTIFCILFFSLSLSSKVSFFIQIHGRLCPCFTSWHDFFISSLGFITWSADTHTIKKNFKLLFS